MIKAFVFLHGFSAHFVAFLLIIPLASGLLFFAGCGHDHDHSHDHSAADSEDDQGHSHEVGPHGGSVFAVGEHIAHIELAFDSEKGKMTLHITGPDGETPLPLLRCDTGPVCCGCSDGRVT